MKFAAVTFFAGLASAQQVITLSNALYSVVNDQASYQITVGDWFPCSDLFWALQINDEQGTSISIYRTVNDKSYYADNEIPFTGAIPVYQIQDGNVTVTLEPLE
ncbi:hypothetical protein COCC4DRAFT_62469 [Bipolaris maydis ATCC 48331]|uniref:Uncharacterized protein n=2 Tax=Cochliobolus heterostrophus TaxID=5016 RepID=M2UTS3_COCH5|nr:uncharacterized protein COCC4DRAFT_62469 [Bipolaris maydis ATCC 48331]EMD96971.1 hypothetical protein COCHEDRAFT_1150646 [Bipolaris maydis C5]KAH7558079.1 hypothetical protein BM1_05351 [Bipolaris maydis]ENI03841.1 hypothetical protein COCC4DRAFT_62469 [Bipolaris maydis ATCC 48331]KAJ5052861.1 hypothetical protein J3E74DRAFT_411868 [Bipolaris maydis]KAJ6201389.1 hypothetical protein J3E72DRAFT_265150 [Bipolaris maydis]